MHSSLVGILTLLRESFDSVFASFLDLTKLANRKAWVLIAPSTFGTTAVSRVVLS